MKSLKTLMTIFTLILFYFALSSSSALAANIVVDKQTGQSVPGIFHTHNYANDSACIQAALDNSKSGDTITIRKGDYYLPLEIHQTGKNLNIVGEGKVTLHMLTPDRVIKNFPEQSQLFFNGSQVASTNISFNAKKSSSQIVLTDASQVRKNDLIKIWKKVQWCPLNVPDNYPDQMTGEMYAIKSVNGKIATLNQPLLRDYYLSETVQVEVYRPIKMHIQNIRIEDTGTTMWHHAISMQYCKDSSVTDSWFNNSGFGAVCLYSCFNVNVSRNEMYNSLYPGSGYGINVASGSAFVNITHNYIENCRHAITGNSAELKSLNRDVFIADNTLKGANIRGSWVVDAHAVTINFVVTGNKIYPQLPYFYAFSDGTQQSIFSDNEIYGGYGGIFKRGGVTGGVHIYENNTFNGISGDMYRGGDGTDNLLIIRNNTQNKGTYGIDFLKKESFKNIIISENTFANLKREGVYIDGNSFKNGAVKIQNNILINVNTSVSSSGIVVKNIQNAVISGNRVFKNLLVPVAAFSASPTSGSAPLKVAFTDRSVGSATSWKWSFGDGTSSTQKNPSHTYSKAGKYNVSLTVRNAAGSNKITKSNYIAVNALKPPLPAFSASPLNGKAPLTVKFTDKSTNNPTSWVWDFGDKSTSTVQNPVHKYTKAGKFTVKLTIKNSKGTNWITKKSYVNVK